ncbi:MAG: citrate transporter [Succinivibrio sp.]
MKLLFLLGMIIPEFAFGSEFLTKSSVFGIRIEMLIFALILTGIAIFYQHTLKVAVIGLLALCFYKYEFQDGFSVIKTIAGQYDAEGNFVEGSYLTYVNLILMLPGFAVLAKIFELSNLSNLIIKRLPGGILGCMSIIAFIFVLSTFLDNIAAVMIGGTISYKLFRGNVHIGYVAAMCAAANAGGTGSVVGDTTTTLIWLSGVNPLELTKAFIPAVIAMIVVAYFASVQQAKYCAENFEINAEGKTDLSKILVVIMILVFAILGNYYYGLPAFGIWAGILLGRLITKFPVSSYKSACESTLFLTILVFCAQLVPVESIPDASNLSTLTLGFISAVFNNIPLTQMCLEKGGFDFALLSYAVGFGGSMIWFGSSAGVAICDVYNKARSFVSYLRYGWHVPLGFITGFLVYIFIF